MPKKQQKKPINFHFVFIGFLLFLFLMLPFLKTNGYSFNAFLKNSFKSSNLGQSQDIGEVYNVDINDFYAVPSEIYIAKNDVIRFLNKTESQVKLISQYKTLTLYTGDDYFEQYPKDGEYKVDLVMGDKQITVLVYVK